MASHDFLRDIKIVQNENGYRFSVDAILLASFVNIPRAKMIADLGAGSGVIGLLLAREYPDARISLVELQDTLAERAEENIALNELQQRVKTVRADIKDIASVESPLPHNSFDMVVSNPPFRKPKTGLISPEDERAVARHELKLELKDLLEAASTLLKHHGRFFMIHLPERLVEILRFMERHALEPKRVRTVHSYLRTEAKMVLIEAAKGGRTGLKIENPLVIYNEDGSYTDEMKEIYRIS
ncbi:MAG: tRNA1(Val) (adenine(37)-N6)-methyltransferase [Nitrospirae bacterium]|nr:MAG: tRNA1(Val) (adenine(37)-N6)-methyltransferase [Nitrospirota bacterium]